MEAMALLATAKELGFDLGQIVSLVLMYIMLRRDLMKVFDVQFQKLIDAIKSLEKVHNDRLERIENHIGINKGKLEIK